MIKNNIKVNLISVIGIDEDKCVSCHACITACPVKYCNNGSGDSVEVNSDMCIACGNCIKACSHDARFFIDDFDVFLNDVYHSEKIVAIVAPSVAASFPDQYLNLNGWLKELGVKAVFDVSFGAELTVKTYIEHIKKNNPKVVIAQPCPAIVSYIELYKPKLLNYLAPADSPMLHTIKMIKEYYPQYQNHKIAVISPCNAKKREFQETELGDYNIAHISINEYLKESNISLSDFAKAGFDNPEAERAVLFSTPGGLLQTIERWLPDFRYNTRKIEGIENIYEYLDDLDEMIEQGKSPLLIDCLNCNLGCNGGPLTVNKDKPQDEIEYYVNKRNREMQESYLKKNENNRELTQKEIEETINRFWKDGLYHRDYVNLWQNVTLQYPTKEQVTEIYHLMHKYTDDDIYNCTACGYGSCEKMAVAIFNGLNRPENCHFYLSTQNEISHRETKASQKRLQTILDTSLEGFVQVNNDEIIVSANPAMKKILRKEDIIGHSLFDFLDKENSDILHQHLELRRENKNSSYELEFTQSNGSKIHCRVSGTPLYNEENKQIGSFAMITNINELKTAQERLRNANHELEERVKERTAELNDTVEELRTSQEVIEDYNRELEKLSIVASKTDNAIIIMDNNGDILWINDAFKKMYAYSAEQLANLIGKNIVEASSNNNIKEIFDDCIKNKISRNYENQSCTKAGEKIWTLTTLTPITDEEGTVHKLIAIDTDITERKAAEEKVKTANRNLKIQQQEILEKNEELQQQKEEIQAQAEHLENTNEELEKLSIVASEIDNAVLITDKNGNFEWINHSFHKMFGIEPKKIKDKKLINPQTPEYIKKTIERCIEQKKSLSYEFETTSLQQNKWIQATITPILDEKNEISKLVVVDSDITKIKEAEDDIMRKSEKIMSQATSIELANKKLEKLSIVAKQTDNAIAIMDGKGNFEWVNDGFTRLYGYSLKQYIKKKGRNLLKSSTNPEIKKAINKCINQKQSVSYECYTITADGSKKWAQTTLSPILDKNGNIKRLVAIDSDISKLKEAEEQILQKQEEILAQSEALKESQQHLANIIDFLPDPVMVINDKGEVTAWNKAMEHLTGVKAVDMVGKGNYEYAIPFYGKPRPILIDLVFEPIENVAKKYNAVKRKGNILIGETYVPSLAIGEAYLLGTASALKDSKGNVVYAIELIKNITDRKKDEVKLTNAFNQLKEQNKKINEQKDEIVRKNLELDELVEELKTTTEIIEDYNQELEKLSIVASQTDNAVMIMDEKGNFEWFNEGFTRLYGYTFYEYTKEKSDNILNTCTTDYARNAITNCMKEKKTSIYESLMIHKNGSRIWTQTTITPILDEKGNISKLVAIDSDITKLKDAEAEILQQKEEIAFQRDEIEKQRDIANKQKEKVMDSILYASRIQSAVLPPQSQIEKLLPEHFILYKPRDIVSGDFYWIDKMDDKIIIVAADCTGHGVPGAFLSLLGTAFLNEIVNKKALDKADQLRADEILNQLRQYVIKSLHQTGKEMEAKDGMDISLCIYDPAQNKLQYSGAYNPLYLIRKDNEKEKYDFIKIKGDKMPIGIYFRGIKPFTNHRIDLKKGDTLYIFSDGYVDQFGGEHGRKFLAKNFRRLLLSIQDKSMNEQKQILDDTLEEWMGDTEQVDDILVFGMRLSE